MLNKLNGQSVEEVVISITADLVQDWGLDLDEGIAGSTLLVKDLEFASVDIIQLCVALEQHFDRKLGFQEMLMKDGSYVGDLSVSQVAVFIEPKLNKNEGT